MDENEQTVARGASGCAGSEINVVRRGPVNGSVISFSTRRGMEHCLPAQSKRRVFWRPRFGLRTFLVGIAFVSVLLAIATSIFVPWYRDQSKTDELNAVNAQVFTEPRGQFLLRQFIGDTLSQRSICLHLDDPRIDDDWIENLHGMEHVEVLSIRSSNLTDAGLRELRNWPNLQRLNLVDTKVTESGVAALRQSLPKLRLVESRQTRP